MTHSYQLFRIAKAACIALCLGIATQASASSDIQVRHLASEQNIVTITRAQKYLLLPVQDDAPEAQVRIVKDNMPVGVAFNVRLARQRIDYYVPLELSAYQGDNVSISIMGLPEHAQCWKGLKQSDTFDLGNREKFRPLYHHTPLYGWMNDPNGMFYKDGVYHLYFQHNPYGSLWGNMSWGHSTSTDLVNWEFQGIPIRPDAWGTIFSGSAVIDHENTAGFGKGAVVAIYTSDNRGSQSQSIAYSLSNDQGEKVHMYYDIQRKKFVMDRSESGLTGFSRDFPALTAAPVQDTDDIHLRIFVDRSSIEVFGDGGEYVMTNRVFPSTPYNTLTFEGRHGNYEVKSLSVYKIRTARDPH